MDIRASAIRWWRSATSATIAGAPVWRVVAIVLSGLILVYGLYRQIFVQYQGTASDDFYSYYQAALAVRSGGNPFVGVATWIHGYAPGDPLVATYYVYAPFFAFLLVPLTIVPYEAARVIWALLTMAFLLAAIYAALRAAGERPSTLSVLALGAAASLMAFVRLEFQWGQADVLLLFLLCAALWARNANRTTLAGILLAVACVTKPQLLVFVAYLLWKREYRFAAVTSGGFVVFLLAPFALLGGDALRDQLSVWSFWSNQYVSFIDNQAPKGVLARLFTINPNTHPVIVAPWLMTTLWLAIVVSVVALIVALVRSSRRKDDAATFLEVGLVVTGMLLISPLTEYIYLTLLVVPLVALYALARQHWGKGRPFYIIGIGTAVIWALTWLPLQNIEYAFWQRMLAGSPATPLYVFLAVPYLYVVIAVFVLNIYAIRQETTPAASLLKLVAGVPGLVYGRLVEYATVATSLRTRRSAGHGDSALTNDEKDKQTKAILHANYTGNRLGE